MKKPMINAGAALFIATIVTIVVIIFLNLRNEGIIKMDGGWMTYQDKCIPERKVLCPLDRKTGNV